MKSISKEERKAYADAYKETKTMMGVAQVKNTSNGKVFIAAYPNLKNKWLTMQSMLDMGQFVNAGLQRDWNELGKQAFEYSVLEEKPTDDVADSRWECKQMEKRWMEQLQPYGERGYHKAVQH
jgi:hypothetical protein